MFLRMSPSSTALRAKVLSYAGGIQGFYTKRCHRNLKKGSFNWKLRGLVLFLLVEIDRLENCPPLPGPSFPKTLPIKILG